MQDFALRAVRGDGPCRTLVEPLGQKGVIQHDLAVRKGVQDLERVADVHLPADLW